MKVIGNITAETFNNVVLTNTGSVENFLSENGTYINPSLISPYDLDFKASANAPLSLALAIYGNATIVGTENKTGLVTGVSYYGSTDAGNTFSLIGNHTALISWVSANAGISIYLKASMITTSTQSQVVNVTYIKS